MTQQTGDGGSAPERIPVLLDCDPGIDDAMAIFYGLGAPEIDIVAIGTVWGNVPVETATSNALRLLEIAGRPDIPVAQGAPRPLMGPEPTFSGIIHGKDGQGNANLPPPTTRPTGESAAEQIVRLSRERPGELTLVAVGPLTNLAIAVSLDPTLASRIKSVVIMGGAFLVPGNARPVGEANIWHDPEAAQIVLDAGWPVTVVGLDVTTKARVSQEVFDQLRDSGTSAGRHLHRIVGTYLDAYEQRYGRREGAMHDALALGIAADPTLVLRAPRTRVDVELTGQHTRGMTVADLRWWITREDANASVVLEADTERFIQRWIEVIGGGTGAP